MLSQPIQTIDAFGGSYSEYIVEPEIQDDDFESEVQYLSVDPDDTEPGLRILLTLVSTIDNKTVNIDVLTTSLSASVALFQAIRLVYAVFKPSEYVATGYRLIEDAPF